MPAAFSSSNNLARFVQLLAFSAVAVALAVVSWRGTSLKLPDVGQFAGVVGAALLGGVLNPVKDLAVAKGAAELLSTKFDALWVTAVVVGGGSIVNCALALAIHGDRHVNAAPALAALVTAFAALFVDTSHATHLPDPATTASGTGGGGAGGSPGGGGGGGGGSDATGARAGADGGS